jgi:hypothetical protein
VAGLRRPAAERGRAAMPPRRRAAPSDHDLRLAALRAAD